MNLPLSLSLAPVKYFGSKRHLLSRLVPKIRDLWQGGFVVDAFSGTSAVGLAVSEFAPVIAIDTQHYARVMARALLDRGPHYSEVARRALRRVLEASSPQEKGFFERAYSDSYFSTQQAKDIDRLRNLVEYSVARLPTLSDALILVGLYHGMSKAVASPGHFAQPLGVEVCFRERNESVHRRAVQFLTGLARDALPPAASQANIMVCGDALDFLDSVDQEVDLVFADPPYSGAQYSRFYHLLETATIGDEPFVEGRGGYRPDRYKSPFCHKTRVEDAFRRLLQKTADLGASLILTYPSNRGHLNGLGWSVEDVSRLARKWFSSVRVEYVQTLQSRLGGSGRVTRVEGILVAR
jgi:adenine-specific DNA methylase